MNVVSLRGILTSRYTTYDTQTAFREIQTPWVYPEYMCLGRVPPYATSAYPGVTTLY